MEELTSLFEQLLHDLKSVDIAHAEFRKMMAEDPELRDVYREWCHETGHSERRGFLEFAEEYIESQESIWDSLNDYDE